MRVMNRAQALVYDVFVVIIIRPSWLEVEKATIFLMSFCVRAQMAVNRVVIAPRHNVRF